jgi:hypothetical protein
MSEVNVTAGDRVFYYSRIRAVLLVIAVLCASGAFAVSASRSRSVLAYYVAGLLLFGLVLMRRYVTVRFRPSNWLIRMTDLGLFIQFRSYLNCHLPAEDLTVVFVPYDGIRSARLVRERNKVPDTDGGTAVQTLRFVELELAGDPAPLAQALATELARPAPGEKRWYGSTSTLYKHYPVRMPYPPFLQVQWSIVPGPAAALEALRPYATIADPVLISQDHTHLKELTQSEQEERIRELDTQGKTIAAIYITRRLYGCGLTEAKKFVEGLRNRSGVGASR